MPLLLDTCAVIWLTNGDAVSDHCVTALNNSRESGEPIFVSPFTAWEMGLLVARGRLSLLMLPQRWFDRILQAPGTRLADMSTDILIASSFLPGAPPNDPADRIIAATAREHGYALVTRDRALLDYAEQGHIQSIVC
jgi:PIN domain nuclease of toxin-antitoxin system